MNSLDAIVGLLGRLGVQPYSTRHMFELSNMQGTDKYAQPYIFQAAKGLAYEINGKRVVVEISRIPESAKKD